MTKIDPANESVQAAESLFTSAIGSFVTHTTMIEMSLNFILGLQLTGASNQKVDILMLEISDQTDFLRRCVLVGNLIKTENDKDLNDEFEQIRKAIIPIFEFRNQILHKAIMRKFDLEAGIEEFLTGQMLVLKKSEGVKTLTTKSIHINDIMEKVEEAHRITKEILLFTQRMARLNVTLRPPQ